MQSFLDDIGRGLGLLKAHPDFAAIALLALVLGLARGQASQPPLAIRAAMLVDTAVIENALPRVEPLNLEVRLKPVEACERELLVLRSF